MIKHLSFPLFILLVIFNLPAQAGEVRIQVRQDLDAPAYHGINKLVEALQNSGMEVTQTAPGASSDARYVIQAGLASDPHIAGAIADGGLEIPHAAEALAILVLPGTDQTRVVLAGSDATGLMYAALDAAQRIGHTPPDEDLFSQLSNTTESPFISDRSVSTYTMHRKWFEQRLYDPDYWTTYFDMLAANRINSYAIIFGYECAGFMAPMYPYFFDVEEFPQVRFNGLSTEEQSRNRDAMQRVIDLAHERGIRVTFGIWDHIYRGAVQAGRIEWAPESITEVTPNVVSGVTAENLAPYTKAALRKLLAVFPDIDAIQFRMHGESGLTHEEIPVFWREVFSMLRELKPSLKFDLRAKGLPDIVIENAVEENLPFRIATKFWMEQIGMSYHPTHVHPQDQHNRRHGYADLLRYPKEYEMHWRVWSGGTLRLLLWGNPGHVRRFVTESVPVYGSNSFEINEMLATKMLSVRHETEPYSIHLPEYRHYKYEIERYWHYFQVWGRIAYNPDADDEIWESEFTRRFGMEAGPHAMRALHRASEVLPRIVASSSRYLYFPLTRGWAAMMRMGDLPVYAEESGTDTEQFQSYSAAAEQVLNGGNAAMITPQQTAAWLKETAIAIRKEAEQADLLAKSLDPNHRRELDATLVDLRILASLAEYHAERIPAALWYNIYLKTSDQFALDQATAGESAAIDAWREIVKVADGVYGEHLRFGSRPIDPEQGEGYRVGGKPWPAAHSRAFPENWAEELTKLEAGLTELKSLSGKEVLDDATRAILQERMKLVPRSPVSVMLPEVGPATPGQDLLVEVKVSDPGEIKSIQLRFRHLTQFEDYQMADMALNTSKGTYTATIPGEFIDTKWDLMYFVEIIDSEGRGAKIPDMMKELPYVIIPVNRD